MKILGIETSCDETAISLVSGEGDKLSVEKNIVLSQIATHQKYGGVVPEVAAREHVNAIMPMLENEVPSDGEGIDAIAVTAGPGLSPALRVGVEAAKALAFSWDKPLIALSHLEGHIYANWIGKGKEGIKGRGGNEVPSFPALCLIVSGGHTELILMKDHGEFERLGETLDDAAGEAFDKVASMLGLKYPGGPAISKLAEGGNKEVFDFPRGLLDRPDLNFSFSGLKTSVLYTLRKLVDDVGATFRSPESTGSLKASPTVEDLSEQTRKDIAASFQEAVVDVLVRKTMRAAEKYKPASIVLAGGVAANKELRTRLQESSQKTSSPSFAEASEDRYVALAEAGDSPLAKGREFKVFVPDMQYTTDNAAMMAAAGYFRARDKKNFVDPLTLVADSNMDIV